MTVNALWEAVTGTPGTQDWYDTVRTVDRSEAAEAERKATNKAVHAERRERAAKAKAESASEKQLKYLASLVAKAGRERFDAEFDKAVKGTGIAPRGADERTQVALGRLSKAAARKLITALVGP
ncbi:hypothetical protein [Prescottella equi]|uniref:hypothetical protein n=1 Tax=Rhodococcus hoagii TaxID=43767 RepID=UPI001C93152B|nr:hypothetical protein [Prescottella equi]